jgi:hypothetical protein
VASIEELTAGVRAVLAQVAAARAALTGVAAPIEEAGRTYAQLGAGSAEPDLADSAACLRTAYIQCRNTVAMLDQADDRLDAYLAAIIGTPIGRTAPPAAANPAPPTGEPWRLTGDRVDKLRGELPPPITSAEWGTGRKTHGRWVGPDGVVRKIVSGESSVPAKARRYFAALGLAVELTSVMLPEGCSLTVHAPNYRRTFTGGKNP